MHAQENQNYNQIWKHCLNKDVASLIFRKGSLANLFEFTFDGLLISIKRYNLLYVLIYAFNKQCGFNYIK